jgi:hypothetical protein
MMKNSMEKMLQKSRLAAVYAAIEDSAIRQAVLAEFESLCGASDLSDKTLAGYLLRSILPAVAFRRILPQNGFADGDVLAMIRDSLLESARPMAKMFCAMGRLPFFFPLLRLMCPLSVKSGFREPGWHFEWKDNTKNLIAFDAHSCFYARVLQNLNAPELTRFFCEIDDVIYGNIPKVRWGRTKTIGGGDSICDFSFFNERLPKRRAAPP